MLAILRDIMEVNFVGNDKENRMLWKEGIIFILFLEQISRHSIIVKRG